MKVSRRVRRVLLKVPRFVPPHAIAHALAKDYRTLISHWENIARHTILDRWSTNTRAVAAQNARADASPWVVERMHRLIVDVSTDVHPTSLAVPIDRTATRVDAKVLAYTERLVPISIRNTDVGLMIDGFRRDNVSRIKSVADDLTGGLSAYLEKAELGGYDTDRMGREIAAQFKVSAAKASFIARDQTLKLSGQVTRARQTQAGISQYMWSTSGDERVRDGDPRGADHASLDGEVFRWGEPPITNPDTGETNEPGQDYQCRCVAIPVLPDIADLEDFDPSTFDLSSLDPPAE